MSTHKLAEGLAGLGRNGDSMLMHVTPHEVAGLQSLAKSQGTSLTVNPHTGLPEAFNLGGFFGSLLPTIAGFGASMVPGLQPLGLSAMQAGILAGAATGALTSQDPLSGALMGGLGGYGGAGLGKAASGFSATNAGANVADPIVQDQLKNKAVGQVGKVIDPTVQQQISMYTPSGTLGQEPGIMTGAGAGTNEATYGSLLDNTATTTYGNYAPDYTPIAGATQGTGGYQTPTLGGNIQQAYNNVAAAPMDFISQNKMAVGMPIAGAVLGGLEASDIYGDPISVPKKKIPTLNLSDTNYPSMNLNTNYAEGGLTDLYESRDGTPAQNTLMEGYGLDRLNRMAQGGMAYADGGDVGMNLDQLPSLNLNTGQGAGAGMGGDARYSMGTSGMFGGTGLSEKLLSQMSPSDRAVFLNDPNMRMFMNINEVPKQTYYTSSGNRVSGYADGGPIAFADGGLPSIAKGGYLDGPGDGMSDSIPATIEDKQPARLADGEFVIPADVVSHLGNGSTKAGSQRLYSMLDKVRKARTGTKKQGKQINPSKYMPA